MLFLDLDRFKIVNDSLGHDTGDAVLKEVGNRFARAVRAGETAARFSGDEFVFIVRDIETVDDAIEAAKRLLAVLEQPIHVGNHDLTVTGSIGIVLPGHRCRSRDAPAGRGHGDVRGEEDGPEHLRAVRPGPAPPLGRPADHGDRAPSGAGGGPVRAALPTCRGAPSPRGPSARRPSSAGTIRGSGSSRRSSSSRWPRRPGLIIPIGRWVFDQALAQLAAWDAEADGPRSGVAGGQPVGPAARRSRDRRHGPSRARHVPHRSERASRSRSPNRRSWPTARPPGGHWRA